MELTSIPPEIWREIFLFIEPYDILMLRMTSRFFADYINPQSTLREIGHPRKRNYYLNCNGWNYISMALSAIFDGNRNSAKLIIDLVLHSKSPIFIQRILFMGSGIFREVIKLYNNPDLIKLDLDKFARINLPIERDIENLYPYHLLEKGIAFPICGVEFENVSQIDLHMYLLRSGKIAILRSLLLQMPHDSPSDNICDLFIAKYGCVGTFGIEFKWFIAGISSCPGCEILIRHIMKKHKILLPYYEDACSEYLLICNKRDTSIGSLDKLDKINFISTKDYNEIVKKHKLESPPE